MSQKLWTKDGKVVVDAQGKPILCEECPCGSRCYEEIAAMRAEAESGGYDLHVGEFVKVDHRTSSLRSAWWPPSGEWETYVAFYETGSTWETLDCSCYRKSFAKVVGRSVRDYRFLSYPGACSGCRDLRELLLSYPEVFGLDGVSYGSLAIYMSSSSGGYYMLPKSSKYDIDYRTFNFLLPYDSYGSKVLAVVEPGSPSSFSTIGGVASSTAYFTGEYRVPYGEDELTAHGWHVLTGNTYRYYAITPQTVRNFASQEEAEAHAGNTLTVPSYGKMNDSDYGAIVEWTNPPDASVHNYPGWVEQVGPSEWRACDGYSGAKTTSTPSRTGETGFIYELQYLTTNRGIIHSGGLYAGRLHVYGRSELPGADSSVWESFDVDCEIDEDMHWCHPGLFGEDVP